MLILHATVMIKPDARGRWYEILNALVPPSREEEACRSYSVYESVESANTFIFVEEWTSLDGFHSHNRSPHVAAFFDALDELLAQPPEGTISDVSSTMSLGEALAASGVALPSRPQ